MRMPAFALFERALRLETRSWLICLTRAGLLLVILFVLLPIQSMANAGWYGAPGLRFLEPMVWINLVCITLAGLSYFASAITEEKEEMTLGLLRMTDLNPVAILLGKSTSRLVGALLLLLVQVPFVLLAVTLGGVGMVQIAAAYSTLLAYMFFICNLALLLSVIFRNTATAGGVGLFILILFFFGCYWVAAMGNGLIASGYINPAKGVWPVVTSVIGYWRQATPSERIVSIFQTGFTGPVAGFQVFSNLVAGVLLFLIAWLVFDWCTREEKDTAPARRWLIGRKNRRSRIPPHLVGPGAITWKDFTFIGGGKIGLLLKFALLGLLVGICNFICYETDSPITWQFEGGTLIWSSILMTAIWLALEASRIFKDEVRWKTLSSLITLPISIQELAYRKVVGALTATLPLLGGAVVGMVMVPDKVADFINEIFRHSSSLGTLLVMFVQFLLFLHLTAFLSLVIKRGALPLAFAIHFVGGMFVLWFVAIFSMLLRFDGSSYFIAFGCVVLTAILHRGIGYRLERAAAEE
jgi:ABC-type transport system involved in multi-copper enzyme maturation permease subunit